MRIAFQGVRGAYSEEAALKRFPEGEPDGFPYSEQVVEAVDSGRAEYGILPLENSIAGPVGVNLDLFLAHDIFIIDEVYLSIDHCLLAKPGVKLGDVWSVYSHPIALAQCREFLNAHGFKAVPEYDTAGSAELIAGHGRPGEAAIAPRRCAALYGLEVLAENIQTVRANITRFGLFTRRDKVPPGLKMEKTSLAFSAAHRPGALLDCLKRFAENGVNLTKLESRPVASDPFAYVFLADLLGGMEDAPVKKALAALAADAGSLKILGSYPLGAR
ncbi:MAG: prephenate dehydratase [Elusimicrobia bacterium]|nr:prephenate dehydratase [Elusimicrobiota bacterium]